MAQYFGGHPGRSPSCKSSPRRGCEYRPSDVVYLLSSRLKVWDNEYFVDLLEYDWVQEESPGGNIQWIPVPKADATDTEVPDIIMLTADIALLYVSAEPRAHPH